MKNRSTSIFYHIAFVLFGAVSIIILSLLIAVPLSKHLRLKNDPAQYYINRYFEDRVLLSMTSNDPFSRSIFIDSTKENVPWDSSTQIISLPSNVDLYEATERVPSDSTLVAIQFETKNARTGTLTLYPFTNDAQEIVKQYNAVLPKSVSRLQRLIASGSGEVSEIEKKEIEVLEEIKNYSYEPSDLYVKVLYAMKNDQIYE